VIDSRPWHNLGNLVGAGEWRAGSGIHISEPSICAREPTMNEDVLNASIRRFLKTVGVTSQREIEKAIRAALADGRLKGQETLPAKMTLTVGTVNLTYAIDGAIELE
jgi:hypothetical protein